MEDFLDITGESPTGDNLAVVVLLLDTLVIGVTVTAGFFPTAAAEARICVSSTACLEGSFTVKLRGMSRPAEVRPPVVVAVAVAVAVVAVAGLDSDTGRTAKEGAKV
jgi:hypothetical protein